MVGVDNELESYADPTPAQRGNGRLTSQPQSMPGSRRCARESSCSSYCQVTSLSGVWRFDPEIEQAISISFGACFMSASLPVKVLESNTNNEQG